MLRHKYLVSTLLLTLSQNIAADDEFHGLDGIFEPNGNNNLLSLFQEQDEIEVVQPEDEPIINRFKGLTNIQDKVLADLKSDGPTMIQNVTIEGKTIINGPATIEKATFQDLTINGPFEATNILFESANLNGPVKLNLATAKKNIIANGPFIAKNSHFYDLKVNCSEMTLDKSTLVNLTVTDNNDLKNQKQMLYLKNNSFIKGKIKFDSGKGVVLLMNNKLQPEQLDGGEIIYVN